MAAFYRTKEHRTCRNGLHFMAKEHWMCRAGLGCILYDKEAQGVQKWAAAFYGKGALMCRAGQGCVL